MTDNPTPSPIEPIVFRTPGITRAVQVLVSTVVGFGGVGIAGAAAGLLYVLLVDAMGVPRVPAVVAATLAGLGLLWLTWHVVVPPLRLHVSITPWSVTMGGGWLRREFACHDVEELSVPLRGSEHGVALEGGGRKAFVRLTPADENACIDILRACCVNAIYVDAAGKEHLPACGERPRFTLGVLYRRTRSLAAAALFSGIVCLVLTLLFAPGLLAEFRARGQKVNWGDFAYSCRFLLVVAVGAFFTLRLAWIKWRQMKAIARTISETPPDESALPR